MGLKMGRRVDFAEKVKKGPGRKAKKQGPPNLGIVSNTRTKKFVVPGSNEPKKLSRHQKQRAKKRALKKEAKKELKKKKKNTNTNVTEDASSDENEIGSAGEEI